MTPFGYAIESISGSLLRPLMYRGVKATLQYAGSHGVEDSLQQVKLWNGALLQSRDLAEAFTAATQKRAPHFSDE